MTAPANNVTPGLNGHQRHSDALSRDEEQLSPHPRGDDYDDDRPCSKRARSSSPSSVTSSPLHVAGTMMGAEGLRAVGLTAADLQHQITKFDSSEFDVS